MIQSPNSPAQSDVSALRSLRTRLSLVLVVFCMGVVLFVSWVNTSAFEKFLGHQIEDSLVQQARFSGDTAGSYFRYLSTQITMLVKRLQTEPAAKYQGLLANLIASDTDFRAVSFVQIGKAKELKTLAAVAVPGDSPEMWQALNKAIKPAAKSNRLFVDLQGATGAAEAALVLRFKQTKGQPDLAMALVFKKERLFSGILSSGGVLMQLLDAKGNVVLSSRPGPRAAQKSVSPLFKIAAGSDTPYGFRRDYLSATNQSMLGAYANLKDVGAVVTAERDAALASREIGAIAKKTLLWALMVITIAAAVAYMMSGRMIAGLMSVINATRRLASGDLETTVPTERKDELGLLAHAVNDMGGQIKKLLSEQLEQARLARELETAKIVQSLFFPTAELATTESADDLLVYGSYLPASECGGDWWGSYRLGEHHRLICVADAMGHGVPAALVTAMAYAAFSLIAEDVIVTAPSPAVFLTRFNRILYKALKGSISMTAFVAIVDMRDGKMTYANAGHCFPFVLPAAKDDERWRSNRSTGAVLPGILRLPGTPVGYESAPDFKESTTTLFPGDRVVFYSDGLTEARPSKTGAMWGTRGLMTALSNAADCNGKDVHKRLLAAAAAYYGNFAPEDDLTLVVVEMPRAATREQAA